MESREFIQLTNAVVNRLGPSAFAHVPGFSQASIEAHAWDRLVMTMVNSLIDNQIPVTAASRNDLSRLLDYLGVPESSLTPLNIIKAPKLRAKPLVAESETR